MNYVPHAESDIKEMLSACEESELKGLFKNIPEKFQIDGLNLPPGISELELREQLNKISRQNISIKDYDSYLGGGAYEHFIPAVVKSLISRGEFYTAYTPYQPEASQGTLKAIYEYQSLICELFSMDVANASHYDGATALSEAVLLSYNAGSSRGKKKIFISEALNPEYKRVIHTYLRGLPVEIRELPLENGSINLEDLEEAVDEKTLSVVVQNPNFLGVIEPMADIEKIVHQKKALFIACVNPLSLGILSAPGEYNADLAVAEGQPLGNDLSFGGSYLGIFTCKKELLRKIPGRVVGRTKDKNGREGFVLTLQTREQHIRREKATSNICSNQALNALAACIYLAYLGKQGLKELALLNLKKSRYLFSELCKIKGFRPLFEKKSFFNELAVETELSVDTLLQELKKYQIFGGIALKKFYPQYSQALLICVTETKTKEQLDKYIEVIKTVNEKLKLNSA